MRLSVAKPLVNEASQPSARAITGGRRALKFWCSNKGEDMESKSGNQLLTGNDEGSMREKKFLLSIHMMIAA